MAYTIYVRADGPQIYVRLTHWSHQGGTYGSLSSRPFLIDTPQGCAPSNDAVLAAVLRALATELDG